MNKLVIIGASGHGRVIADIAEKNGYTDIVFLDDNKSVKFCSKYPVVGDCSTAMDNKNADFVVAIGNSKIRRKIQCSLIESGLRIVSLVHPAAVVASDAKIGEGTVLMAGAVVNPNVEIGRGCIINTCASVDHDCCIGDFVHVSIGAHVAGTVKIGDNTCVGAGATISNNIDIVPDCVIGAGAVVIKSIGEQGTYVGVPAVKI